MRILLALFLLAGVTDSALAQSWPSRQVRLVIPFAPGGGADIAGRVIGQELSDVLKQPVIIENRTGAGGTIAPNNVAKSPPDGYSMVMGHLGGIAIAPHLYKDLPFDPIKDLSPVTLCVNGLSVLVVNPDLPVKTVGELIAYAKANPSKLSFSSAGSGTDTHLAGELFKTMTGTSMVHVPYKGGAPALVDLLAGRVQLAFASVATTITSIQAGKLRAIAMTGKNRFEGLPGVPTISEFWRARLRDQQLVWNLRAREHAAGHHSESECRDDQGPAEARGARQADRGGNSSRSGARQKSFPTMCAPKRTSGARSLPILAQKRSETYLTF